MNIYFSNKLEILYQQLKENLFNKDPSPFAKRWIVVHGPAMKSWLMWQMAQDPDLEIAMGIEVIYLNHIFPRLLSKASLPSFLEMSLALEIEIRQITASFSSLSPAKQTLWQPIAAYLKKEKRLTSLCQHIARLFADYGKYGADSVSEWEKITTPTNWQHALWQKLFCSDKQWTYLSKEFLKPPLALDPTCRLHFFSLSFLSKPEYTFLNSISQETPTHYYLLSPCETFWSDIYSDRESQNLKTFWQNKKASAIQLDNLEELLRDKNPLLANFGRLGREMATQIEESNAEINMCYAEPQSESLLNGIQSDMLTLRNPALDPLTFIHDDDRSIQVHAACSALREIQILYDNILGIIDRSQQDEKPFYPSDFIVMAPNITEYEPHIKSVFESTESQLNCQIIDLKDPSQSLLIKGFWHLIDLGVGRWDAISLMQLFEDAAFQRCHNFSREDVYTIREWIEKAGIRWGDDVLHRNQFLQQNFCSQGMVETSSVGTWDYGLTRLLLGLTMASENSSLSHIPLDNIDFSKSDLLGKWAFIIRSLREDLKPLHDGTDLTLSDWSDYLCCLLRSYLVIDQGDAQASKDYEGLLKHFNELKKASTHFLNDKFCFHSIKKHLEESIQQKSVGYRENHFQAVRFCSMIPLRAIPARAILVIGMGEGKFPKQDIGTSLNLLAKDPKAHYSPSQSDYDRYLFLETLLSAREYFILSYQGSGGDDSKELSPSILVTELLSYLDKYYAMHQGTISSQIIRKHPFDAFDKCYFENEGLFKSYSSIAFAAAKAYYQPKKIASHSFVSDFAIKLKEKHESEYVIDIKNLSAAARHPLKTYLNHTLGIYLDKDEKRLLKTQEDIILSGLDRFLLNQKALKKPVEHVLEKAEKEGKLPLGAFKEVSDRRIKEDSNTIQQQLAKHGFDSKSMFQIEFSKSCLKPLQVRDDHWQLPAIKIRYKDSIDLSIVGHIPTVSPQGMVILSKSSLGDMWKVWPQFLLYHMACQSNAIPMEKQLLFVHQSHSPKLLKSFFKDPKIHLDRFLDYYFTSLESISPMMPDWIPHIVSGDAPALESLMKKQLNDPFASFRDDYTQWALNHANLPDCQALIADWQPRAGELLREMMLHWI